MGENEKTVVRVDPEIQNLIPGFLENRRKAIKAMLEALEQRDYETIRILGHRMKGSGAGYGFDAITDMGDTIEQAAKDKDSAVIRRWINKLVNYLERLEVVYE